ncbi:CGNR zinc finger domain-containing protein [Nonomuraea sp. NPDC000554]|uniref:CGNR zinc finger domain-containing protein n=1 Tax=Nonomuraea sp. NPDC000554 TaxID=3154259 RepID=UPI00332F432D
MDWVWDGGRPSLDLVNTYRDRKTGGREQLREPGDLVAWLEAAGHTGARADDERLREARELRDAISRCVDAALAGAERLPATGEAQVRGQGQDRAVEQVPAAGAVPSPAPDDLAVVNAWAARRRAPVLQLAADLSLVRPAPADPAEAALAEIAHDAVALLGTADRLQIRVCASPTCGLRFTDRSNAGKRQWCSMRRCGNREKVRLHRARLSGGSPEPPPR